jgi:hypothetical protein
VLTQSQQINKAEKKAAGVAETLRLLAPERMASRSAVAASESGNLHTITAIQMKNDQKSVYRTG